jgi:hypothetical protein
MHRHFSSRASADKYASSFLDSEPGTPHSPLSPTTQSPFSVVQFQLFTCCGCSPESVDAPSEQSDPDTSIKSYVEQEQRDWGAQSPRIRNYSMRGSKTRLSPLRLDTCIQILAVAFTVVAPRCGRGVMVTARERLDSRKGGGKAECAVVTVGEAGVAPLRPGETAIGLQVGPLVSLEESICSHRSILG